MKKKDFEEDIKLVEMLADVANKNQLSEIEFEKSVSADSGYFIRIVSAKNSGSKSSSPQDISHKRNTSKSNDKEKIRFPGSIRISFKKMVLAFFYRSLFRTWIFVNEKYLGIKN